MSRPSPALDPLAAPRRVPPERPGPRGGKRDANRRRRTREISRGALERFLDRGVEAVTIDEIAARAGVAKGTFYRYFDGKRDLVEALVAPLRARLVAAFDACAERLERAGAADLTPAYLALAGELAETVTTHRDIVRLALQEARAPADGDRAPIAALAATVAAYALRLTELATDAGLLRPLAPRVTSLAVVGASERLLHAWLSGEDVGDPGAAAGALVAMVLDGLRP